MDVGCVVVDMVIVAQVEEVEESNNEADNRCRRRGVVMRIVVAVDTGVVAPVVLVVDVVVVDVEGFVVVVVVVGVVGVLLILGGDGWGLVEGDPVVVVRGCAGGVVEEPEGVCKCFVVVEVVVVVVECCCCCGDICHVVVVFQDGVDLFLKLLLDVVAVVVVVAVLCDGLTLRLCGQLSVPLSLWSSWLSLCVESSWSNPLSL